MMELLRHPPLTRSCLNRWRKTERGQTCHHDHHNHQQRKAKTKAIWGGEGVARHGDYNKDECRHGTKEQTETKLQIWNVYNAIQNKIFVC
jgi:hypothetical protein